jgi:NAD(P)-dependent dehydrogenase (short-subunit alcohol dehydrogenase family)
MLQGKRCLVTGSSQGIGLAVARACLSAGAQVVLTSEKPRADVPEIEPLLCDAKARYIQADLTRDGEAEFLVGEAWLLLGGLDVIVNNAGTYREPPLLEIRKAHFDAIFALNVWSALAVTQSFVKRAKNGGRILFTSSLNATRSELGHTLYDASKGAMNALVRQLALELAPLGITTVAVAPGLVETPLTDYGMRSEPTARRNTIEQIPLKRIATVEDLAPWYTFLASDAASYATGSIFVVDGGLDARQM